ncbi:MAG TPA: EAL domain-containing protein [Asanoa sp.]
MRTALSSGLGSGVFVVLGLVAAAVFLTADQAASAVAFVVVGIGTAAALAAGPFLFRVDRRWPWLVLSIACVAFTIGAVLRPWAAGRTGPESLLADAFTVPGYGLIFAALAGFARTRVGDKRHALIDGFLVGIGAAIVAALLFSLPAAGITDRSDAISGLAGVYPLFDVLLVLLVLNLAFATAVRGASYVLIIVSSTLLLIGDVAYAVIGRTGALTGPRLLDLPFVLGFVLIGAAALHPTMKELSRTVRLPVQAWSLWRLLLIGPALAVPFILTAVLAKTTSLDRLILAAGGAAMVALLISRAVSAVQGYAAAQRRYEHQATHDCLTGLPNRGLLVADVGRMLAQPASADRPLWLYFLDLDGFKLVNDSWGHDAGDRVIVEVAQRLLRLLPPDAVLARVGGDEFVIARVCPVAEAESLADAVLDALRQPLPAPAGDVVVAVSVGVASSAVGVTGVSAEDLLRDADTAMYQAKADGRGRWVMFDPSMHDRVRERIDIESALRSALDNGQLHLAYQPIVTLGDSRLAGAEALIRWDHPHRGSVPPTLFVPVAEETGLIAEIGRWVLREALWQLAEWRATGVVSEAFWMSINISPRQLRDPRLPEQVADALAEYGLPGSAVMLEITESVMIDSTEVTDGVFAQLRALGIRLAVDDFGTGFSALGYLRRHPVTGVKVDRSFVGGLGANPEDEEIVRAVVAMSFALRLSVVAEGVQSPVQRDVLRTLGVTYGQGWLWSRPVEPETFAKRWGAGSGGRQLVRPERLRVDRGRDDLGGEGLERPPDGHRETNGLVSRADVERRNATVGSYAIPEAVDD